MCHKSFALGLRYTDKGSVSSTQGKVPRNGGHVVGREETPMRVVHSEYVLSWYRVRPRLQTYRSYRRFEFENVRLNHKHLLVSSK